MRILNVKKPRVIFLENVKNLVGHDNGKTFQIIIDSLKEAGFEHIKYNVLNAMNFGNIPQNRERIYIVAFRNEKDKCKTSEKYVLHIMQIRCIICAENIP